MNVYVSAAVSRNSWIIVVLLTAYELAGQGTISTITIGPVAIAHLKFLRVFVPTIVSYVLYETDPPSGTVDGE